MTDHHDVKRILWVTYDFPPRQAAGAFRPVGLYKYLDKSRYAIEFLTSRAESFASGERMLDDIRPTPVVHRAGGTPLDRILEPLKRVLGRFGRATPVSARKPLWERIGYRLALALAFPDKHVLWGCRASLKALWLHLRHRYDVVYTTSHPESAHLPGLLLRLTGITWVVDYRYGGPMWTTVLSMRRKSVWSSRLALAYQRYVLRHADIVIVQSETLREHFIARFGLDPEHIRAIPNGYDEDGFQSFDSQAPAFERGPGELHLLHVGGDWYPDPPHVANLRDLLGRLKAECGCSAVVLHAVGVDILGDNGDDAAREFRYVFHGPKPHAQISSYLATADAFILSTMARTDAAESIVGFLPAKLWEYLRAGKAILWMGPEDDAWRYAEECGAVIYLGSLGDPRRLPAHSVLAAIRAGARNKEHALNHTWQQRARLFADALETVLH